MSYEEILEYCAKQRMITGYYNLPAEIENVGTEKIKDLENAVEARYSQLKKTADDHRKTKTPEYQEALDTYRQIIAAIRNTVHEEDGRMTATITDDQHEQLNSLVFYGVEEAKITSILSELNVGHITFKSPTKE